MTPRITWAREPHELPDPATVDVDLGEVGHQLADVAERLRQVGLQVGPITWRDTNRDWPDHIVGERNLASAPDSVGMALEEAGTEQVDGEIVLYAGGWADLFIGHVHPPRVRQGLASFTSTAQAVQIVKAFDAAVRDAITGDPTDER